jgi:hypothetical protein
VAIQLSRKLRVGVRQKPLRAIKMAPAKASERVIAGRFGYMTPSRKFRNFLEGVHSEKLSNTGTPEPAGLFRLLHGKFDWRQGRRRFFSRNVTKIFFDKRLSLFNIKITGNGQGGVIGFIVGIVEGPNFLKVAASKSSIEPIGGVR